MVQVGECVGHGLAAECADKLKIVDAIARKSKESKGRKRPTKSFTSAFSLSDKTQKHTEGSANDYGGITGQVVQELSRQLKKLNDPKQKSKASGLRTGSKPNAPQMQLVAEGEHEDVDNEDVDIKVYLFNDDGTLRRDEDDGEIVRPVLDTFGDQRSQDATTTNELLGELIRLQKEYQQKQGQEESSLKDIQEIERLLIETFGSRPSSETDDEDLEEQETPVTVKRKRVEL
jgi:hypothetical protein